LSKQKPLKDFLFVIIQTVLFVAYIAPITLFTLDLPQWLKYIGLIIFCIGVFIGIIAIVQLNKNLSPFPTPVETGILLKKGAYRFSRHPIYSGILIFGFGYALYQASTYKFLITLILSVLFYLKSLYEEQLLIEKYPDYRDYKNKIGRFLPKLKSKFF